METNVCPISNGLKGWKMTFWNDETTIT